MANKPPGNPSSFDSGFGVLRDRVDWESQIAAIAARFDQEYSGKTPDLPDEVKSMPIYQERLAGLLQAKLTSPFWQLAKPQKNQRCLDIGCGVGFLIYAWREWDALFYGQEVSTIARDLLNARGPQLNSKLFKGVQLAPAHQLSYEANQFDLVISTGVSCYYPSDYWSLVLAEVKRVLKPGGFFVFDVVDSELATAENWAILETYLGAEVHLEPLIHWKRMIQATGAKVVKSHSGEIFQLLKVSF
ncbi:MAG: class I SAM-dependent methyltransferase [Leptolyngbyaceae cyanobacterium bins.349]|nr:class I SAM-dependent methyltransferase [Leptolyngbyaceae cyanobacterium bins.349]